MLSTYIFHFATLNIVLVYKDVSNLHAVVSRFFLAMFYDQGMSGVSSK